MLGWPDFLVKLTGYDKETLDEKTVNNVGSFLNEEKNKTLLTPANVEKSSPVAKSMLLWVKAMYDFYFVNRRVKPKKIALAEAEEKSSKLQA